VNKFIEHLVILLAALAAGTGFTRSKEPEPMFTYDENTQTVHSPGTGTIKL
jgi:hypothetical protein